MPNLKLSHYCVPTDPFPDRACGHPTRLLFNSRRPDTQQLVTEQQWEQLSTGAWEALPLTLQDALRAGQFLVPDEEQELDSVLAENRHDIDVNQTLYLVVQPSAACQLGCVYCGQRHEARRLRPDDEDAILNRARGKLKQKSYTRLHVGWFGGEPLLGLPNLRALTPRLVDLAREFGCTYDAKIVTNGLKLTDAVATELSELLDVRRVFVTLDGLAEHHDRRRAWKDGAGSFDRIIENVVNALRRDDLRFRLEVRCNVDVHNADGVIPLLDRLVAEGVQGKLDQFYVAPIHAWGNDADATALSPEDFARWEVEWFAALIRRGFRVRLLPDRKKRVCMAVEPEAELIDAFGNVFNCTEVSFVPAYNDANGENLYSLGTLSGNEKAGRRDRLGAFNLRVEQAEVPCHGCEIFPVCGGACPKLWLEGKRPCPPMKYNLKERLRLHHLLASAE